MITRARGPHCLQDDSLPSAVFGALWLFPEVIVETDFLWAYRNSLKVRKKLRVMMEFAFQSEWTLLAETDRDEICGESDAESRSVGGQLLDHLCEAGNFRGARRFCSLSGGDGHFLTAYALRAAMLQIPLAPALLAWELLCHRGSLARISAYEVDEFFEKFPILISCCLAESKHSAKKESPTSVPLLRAVS